ncbi:MAG: SMC-Scp complex subunit ScpB [Vicinamibacterales bacterium]
MSELKAVVEALIFASPEPLTVKALVKLLDSEPREDVVAAVDALREDYERPGGLQMVEVAGGFQIVTRPELHEWVRRLFHERTTQKLSVAALETLAVIAYRQPVTAPEIAEIRGVNTAGVVGTLVERKLIKIVGRKQVVGRPFLYGTTREFLERFGLNDLSDLPKVEDMSELLGFDLPASVGEPDPQHALPFGPGTGGEAASGGAGGEAASGDAADVEAGDDRPDAGAGHAPPDAGAGDDEAGDDEAATAGADRGDRDPSVH